MTNSDFRNTDTEELKKKGNFASDYDIDCKRHYRFEAGQNNSSGTISYRVLTNHGSSHGFYKKGKLENIMNIRKHKHSQNQNMLCPK